MSRNRSGAADGARQSDAAAVGRADVDDAAPLAAHHVGDESGGQSSAGAGLPGAGLGAAAAPADAAGATAPPPSFQSLGTGGHVDDAAGSGHRRHRLCVVRISRSVLARLRHGRRAGRSAALLYHPYGV